MTGAAAVDVAFLAERYQALRAAVGTVLVGQETPLRLAFMTLVCAGHALLEGVPGVAKTLLVHALAAAVDVRFGRVQFTPDLLPSDIIGTTVLDPAARTADFRPGPLFTDLLLADELNRASAKTQAALLEAMQERAATVDGRAHPLGPYFAVFATQNPVEQEGTYPLPEAQLDRFLVKIVVDYPTAEEEAAILVRYQAADDSPAPIVPVLRGADLDRCRAVARGVIVRDELVAYATALVRATREDAHFTLGASPRAGVHLLRAAKTNAALDGRDYALPEDVQAVFLPTLRHRVQLDPAAEIEGLTPDRALEAALYGVAVPR
jgi:MoxR-like ATPase